MGKTCTSEFFKNVENSEECNLCVFEKLINVCFSQILRETILLLDNNFFLEMI